MAQISDLAAATAINDADEFLLRQTGEDKRATTGLLDSKYTRYVDTLADAVADVTAKVGMVYIVKERAAANGGGGIWDIVLLSSVTPNTIDIIASTGGQIPALALVQRDAEIKAVQFDTTTVTVLIPTDFPDLQSAVDFYLNSETKQNVPIEIKIEAGHALTKGVGVYNADASNIVVTSTDSTVLLAAGFTGVAGVTTGTINGESPDPPLFYTFNGSAPQLKCLIDMANKAGTGTGYMGVNSTGFVHPGAGVKNAGFRGMQWRNGNCFANQSIWDGANGVGIRLHQAARVNANEASADDCCKTVDSTLAAIYVSRASTLEFRDGSCTGSGANGILVRRSIVSAIGVDAKDSTLIAFLAESISKIDTINSLAGGTSPSQTLYQASFSSEMACSGATITTPNNVNRVFRIRDGGQINVNTATTIDAVEVSRANVFLDTVAGTPRFEFNLSSGFGIVYKEGEPATCDFQTKGIWSVRFLTSNKFEAWTTATEILNTGTVASGAFSGQLTLPAPDASLTTIESYSVAVDGRTSTGGWG